VVYVELKGGRVFRPWHEDATEDEVLAVVAAYNADPEVHGILVQLPMPKHINEERVLGAIDYEKDVDGWAGASHVPSFPSAALYAAGCRRLSPVVAGCRRLS